MFDFGHAPRSTVVEKLSAWTIKSDGDDCWRWTGPKTDKGYGAFRVNGLRFLAHRVALASVTTAPTPKHFCCHRCDNPECVNPAHLFWGTAASNNRDRADKGRTVTQFVAGSAHPSHGKFGENHCRSTISENQIQEIRARVASGESQSAVARDLGCHSSWISRIVRNQARQEA